MDFDGQIHQLEIVVGLRKVDEVGKSHEKEHDWTASCSKREVFLDEVCLRSTDV